MSFPPPLSTATIDATLEALVKRDPPPQVVALNEHGLFLPMPPSTPFPQGTLFVGRTSMLELVVAADLPVVIETWERAREIGGASGSVHLLSEPTAPVRIHYLDTRQRYGVLLGLVEGNGEIHGRDTTQTQIRPRVWTARKNEFAVILEVDDVVSHILGWSREELIGHRSLEFIHEDDHVRAISSWMDVRRAPGIEHRIRLRHRNREGSWVWFEFTNRNLLADPTQRCVVAEMVDISDEMAALEALRASERRLRRLNDALPIGVVEIDLSRRIVYRNERLAAIVGEKFADTIGDQLSEVAATDRAPLENAIDSALEAAADTDLELTLLCSGEKRRCSLNVRGLTTEDGAATGAIICISDITESVRLRDELEFRATYDSLTGCYNRASILSTLQTIVAASPCSGNGAAVVFIDLDRFKEVNDRLGHGAGDVLLRATGERLIACARAGEVVGRIGGDEFLVVCRDVASEETALVIAERIAAALAKDVDVGGETIAPRASLGVAWTHDAIDADAMIAAADEAMYRSKHDARGRPTATKPRAAASRVLSSPTASAG